MAIQSWNDSSSDEITQNPLTNSTDSDLANYQSTLQNFRNNLMSNDSSNDNSNIDIPSPRIYDEPYQPSQAQQGRQAQLDQARKAQALSGEVPVPGFGMRLLAALGGQASLDNYMQKEIGRRAGPVMNRLMQEGNKALANEDWDTTNQVASGLSNLIGASPRYAKQAEAYFNKIAERQNNIQANQATIDYTKSQIDMSKQSNIDGIGTLTVNRAKLSPGEFAKLADKQWPELKIGEGATYTTEKGTGETKVIATPIVMGPKSYSADMEKAITNAGFSIQQFATMENKLNTGGDLKGFTYDDIKKWEGVQGQVNQLAQQQINLGNYSIPERLKTGVPQSNIQGMGMPSNIPQPMQPNQLPQQGNNPSQRLNYPQSTTAPATTLQGRTPPSGRVAGSNTTLPTDPTVEETKKYGNFPSNVPDSVIKTALKNPGFRDEILIKMGNDLGQKGMADRANRMGSQQGESPEEISNRIAVRNEANKAGALEAAQLEAKRTGTLLPHQARLSRVAPDGSIEFYRGTSPTVEDANQGKWHEADEATLDIKQQREYNKFWAQANKTFTTLKDAKSEDFDLFNNMISRGIYLPVKIPYLPGGLVGIPGTNISLTQRQAHMFNALVSVANANEAYLNPEGKPQANTADVKGQLTGLMATRDSAITGLRDMMENAYTQMSGNLGDKGHKSEYDINKALKLPDWVYKTETGEAKPQGAKETFQKSLKDTVTEPINNIVNTIKQKYKEGEAKQKQQLEELKNKVLESTGVKGLGNKLAPSINPDTVKSLKTFR